MALHVDDLLIAADKLATMVEIKAKLQKQFKMKGLGEGSFSLGMRIQSDRSNRVLKIDQSQYDGSFDEKGLVFQESCSGDCSVYFTVELAPGTSVNANGSPTINSIRDYRTKIIGCASFCSSNLITLQTTLIGHRVSSLFIGQTGAFIDGACRLRPEPCRRKSLVKGPVRTETTPRSSTQLHLAIICSWPSSSLHILEPNQSVEGRLARVDKMTTNHSATVDTENFANNAFSDFAPLLTLFGDEVTKQFLALSMGMADNILLGIAPIGVITIIVSAIRVGGHRFMKSVIGRFVVLSSYSILLFSVEG